MSSRSFTVTIPAPAAWMNANQRLHGRAAAGTVRLWREAAAIYARKGKLPKLGQVAITATLHFADRRRRDAPNYYPTIKACIDGLVDGEVLDDDADGYVTELTIRPGEMVARRPVGPSGALVLTIREVA
jgi:crossover junction endodeoxyribonuclease RusA